MAFTDWTDMGRTIFAVTSGEYDSYTVHEVFESRAAADAYASFHNDDPYDSDPEYTAEHPPYRVEEWGVISDEEAMGMTLRRRFVLGAWKPGSAVVAYAPMMAREMTASFVVDHDEATEVTETENYVQVYGTDQEEVEATWAAIQKERGW